MSATGELDLTLSGRVVLARLSSSELEAWLCAASEAGAGPQESPTSPGGYAPGFNANNWLVSAGATILGAQSYAWSAKHIIAGSLWRLWNGQNFWTSQDGRFFSANLKEN